MSFKTWTCSDLACGLQSAGVWTGLALILFYKYMYKPGGVLCWCLIMARHALIKTLGSETGLSPQSIQIDDMLPESAGFKVGP